MVGGIIRNILEMEKIDFVTEIGGTGQTCSFDGWGFLEELFRLAKSKTFNGLKAYSSKG